MHVVRDLHTLRRFIAREKSQGHTVGFVPTMGALHRGHISLIHEAKKHCDYVVVSIFVNPKQFAAHEDLDTYPRTEEQDLTLLEQYGTAIAYVPHTDSMYPEHFATNIHIDGPLHEGLCSTTRPLFFDGVALVVLKLFNQVQPDIAIFGEKDYQQLCIIQQMVRDLDLPITVIGAPIIREHDGLALSSRNKYLSDEERNIAPELYTILQRVGTLISKNHHDVHGAIEWGKRQLHDKGFAVDYLELRSEESLLPMQVYHSPCRLLVAATVGTCRLLDNIVI